MDYSSNGALRLLHKVVSHASLLIQAAVFIVVVACAIVFLATWQIWNAHQRDLLNAEQDSANLSRSLSQHAEDTFMQVDITLLDLMERLQTDGLSQARLPRLQKVMNEQIKLLPQLHGEFIYDAQGNWLVTAAGIIPPNANNADREYFQYHKTHDDDRLYIGKVIRSRSTGDLVIPVSHRITNQDGSFGGVALATVYVSSFQQYYNHFSIGKDTALVLMLADGTILYRRPFEEGAIGRSMAKSQLFTEVLPRARSGNATLVSYYDKVERVFGYAMLEQYPLVIAAGLSKREVLRGWRTDSMVFAAGGVGVLAILTLLAWALLRQISFSLRSEKDLLAARDLLTVLNQKLAVQALHDGLTGLANRRQFDIVLQNEMQRSYRDAMPLGLILLDIDFFKKYNDVYGHVSGDECLQRVGQALLALPHRANDLLARYGGEEFAVILPGTDRLGALAFARMVVDRVRALHIPHEANPLGVVTISAGVHAAVPRMPEETAAAFIRSADAALYEAKSQGKNRVCGFGAQA
ncbi:sensor domain-containing diguanylate cyclase [Acerihabitans sp.]|uniref:sensor domain-containing diguanylate cyclase n=1 Tax=Acerihabitans sp. TaxID=2811394 RepID=UPI002ED865A8